MAPGTGKLDYVFLPTHPVPKKSSKPNPEVWPLGHSQGGGGGFEVGAHCSPRILMKHTNRTTQNQELE